MLIQLSFRKVFWLSCLVLITALTVWGAGLAYARSAATPDQTGLESLSNTISVGLITDESGVNDMGFNGMANQGLQQAVIDFGVVATVYTPTNPTDYEPMFQQCVNDGNTLCISSQWLLFDAIYNVAVANPGTSFAAVDAVWQSYPSNLRGMQFSESEAGYMAGTLAGLMTQSDVVAGIGGPAYVPAVVDFIEYFRFGAQCANPAVVSHVAYADSFIDPAQGAALAQGMLGLGADVIFAAAGGTGFGVMTTTVNADAWAIGVDVDMYETFFGGGSVPGANWLLSSAMKRVDQVVYSTIEDVVNTNFTSGTVLYDLAAGGVGLAPFHEADPFVSQNVRDALAVVEQGIIGGSIDPNESCRTYHFLPIVRYAAGFDLKP